MFTKNFPNIFRYVLACALFGGGMIATSMGHAQSSVPIIQAAQIYQDQDKKQELDPSRPPTLDNQNRPDPADPNSSSNQDEPFLEGWQLIAGERYDEAIAWFQARLQTDSRAAIGLGAALFSAERYNEAIQVLGPYAAQSQDPDAWFWLGRAQMGNECPSKAVAAFHRVQQLDAQYENINFWIGSAHLLWRHPRRALDYFNCVQSNQPAVQYQVTLQKGVALSSIGLRGTALALFEEVERSADPGSSEAKSARDLQQSLFEALEESRTTGSIKLGQFYDDNPAVLPDTNIFGNSGSGQFETGATQLQTQFFRLLSDAEDGDLSLGMTTYNTFNYENGGNVDIWDTAVLLTRNRYYYDGKRSYQTNWNAGYDYLLFGYVPLLHRGRFGSGLTIHDDDFRWTTISGQASFLDFMNQGGFDRTPRDVDATNLNGGIDRFRRLGYSNWTANYGFRFDRNLSEGADFEYNGFRGGVGLTWEDPKTRAQLSCAAYYYQRLYDNVDSVFLVRRNDQQYLANVSARIPVCRDRFLVLDYLLDRNDSNVILSDYLRNQFGASLLWEF